MNMNKFYLVLFSLVIVCCLVNVPQAQTYNQVCLDTLSPFTVFNSAWQMTDNGNGIFSLTTTVSTAGYHKWWLLSITGSTTSVIPPNLGVAPNTWAWLITTTTNQSVTFYRNNILDTSWSPASTRIYTTGSISTAAPSGFNGGPRYVGIGLDVWLNCTTDTDSLNTTSQNILMHDDGLNGDKVTGDGVYSVYVPISSMTTYTLPTTEVRQYRVATIYDVLSANAYYIGAGDAFGANWDFAFKATTEAITANFVSDTILLECETHQGRIRYSHIGPDAAPWYAFGDLSGKFGVDTLNRLFDDGTNGDLVSGDGKYSRTIIATYTANTHLVNITNLRYNHYPPFADVGPNGGSWFTATTGQSVLVTFDSNTYLDGFVPFTRFAYTPDSSTWGNHIYDVVGDLSTFFGYGTAPNFNLNSLFTTNDSGISGDLVSGDNIYSYLAVVTSSVSTTSQMRWKATTDTTFTLQIGSNGKSFLGPGTPNNLINAIGGDTIRFEIDIVKGRVRATNLTHAGYPLPSVLGYGGKPATQGVFSAVGGTPPYISWSSSDTSKVQVTGFSGITASINFVNYGSSTITVYDSLGQTGTAVVTVSPTSAPLAPDSAAIQESKQIYWNMME